MSSSYAKKKLKADEKLWGDENSQPFGKYLGCRNCLTVYCPARAPLCPHTFRTGHCHCFLNFLPFCDSVFLAILNRILNYA